MSDTKQSTEDLAILEQLNLDYNTDQASDAKRFSELLADDSSYRRRVSPATATSTSNTSQKREGTWICAAACSIAPGS